MILYCRANIGSCSNISLLIWAIFSFGKASGAGFPAEKDITPDLLANFKISLIADGCKPETLSENE